MRVVSLLAGAAALAFATAAAADPVPVAPISYSPEFQQELNDDLGAREGVYLSAQVTRAVARELAERGATMSASAPLTIEISIIDADPNRPTFQQLADQPSLDGFRSISIGGAELRAVLRGADGSVVSEITHRRYNHSLADIQGAATTWSEARVAIRQFANKVADAYVAAGR
jgi:hypothetical protein